LPFRNTFDKSELRELLFLLGIALAAAPLAGGK
jgi:hypothetical protein